MRRKIFNQVPHGESMYSQISQEETIFITMSLWEKPDL
jgi:hypothetical protein